jgi:hypothetical protein
MNTHIKVLHAARNKVETSKITKNWQHNCKFFVIVNHLPNPVAARSKAWVCGGLLAGIADSNPAGVVVICLF